MTTLRSGTTQRMRWRLKSYMASYMTSPFLPTATLLKNCMHQTTRTTKWLRRGWESLTPCYTRVLFARCLMSMAMSRRRNRRRRIATGPRSSVWSARGTPPCPRRRDRNGRLDHPSKRPSRARAAAGVVHDEVVAAVAGAPRGRGRGGSSSKGGGSSCGGGSSSVSSASCSSHGGGSRPYDRCWR